MTKGVSSFFYMIQSGAPVITVYANINILDIQTTKSNGEANVKRYYYSKTPLTVDFYFRDGEGAIAAYNLRNNEVLWNHTQIGDRAVIVRGNTAETLFFYSKGIWGLRWYVLPMLSVTRLQAVFDFEAKVLVEI